MGWACGTYGWVEGVYRVLVGTPEGKWSLGRPRRRWVDNIRTDLQEVRCGYMDWIGGTQDTDRWRTLVSAVMNLRVVWNAGNFLTSCKSVSFSRRTLHHGVSKFNSWRLLHVSNIVRSLSGRPFVHVVFLWFVFHVFIVRKQSSRWKDMLDIEHMLVYIT